MTITFKSDLEDYSTGFFGLVIISNIRNCQTSARHLRQVSDGILDNITNIVDIAPNILEDIEIIEDNLCEVMECVSIETSNTTPYWYIYTSLLVHIYLLIGTYIRTKCTIIHTRDSKIFKLIS